LVFRGHSFEELFFHLLGFRLLNFSGGTVPFENMFQPEKTLKVVSESLALTYTPWRIIPPGK